MEKCFTADLNQGQRSNDDLALQTYLHLINADQHRPVHIGEKKEALDICIISNSIMLFINVCWFVALKLIFKSWKCNSNKN